MTEEARGRQLLGQPLAWPLAAHLGDQQRFSREKVPLLEALGRKDRFAVFEATKEPLDRLSEVVQRRTSFEETYAAEFRVKNDLDLPSDVLDAVQHNHQPQFHLRNIGRVERPNHPDEPLPFERQEGIAGNLPTALDEVRQARHEPPAPVAIWTVAYLTRLRASSRRLLREDPWALRYGAEVYANFAGPGYRFVVDGTHPDDMPGADWDPAPIPEPDEWQRGPRGSEPMEKPALWLDQRKVVGSDA